MKILPRFLLLTFLFSLPLWLAAAFLDATKIIPVKLPFSALQFLCVLLAAIIVTRSSGGSVHELMLRGIDIHRIKSIKWRIGIFLIMPLVIMLSYMMILWRGTVASEQMTPLLILPIFLIVYGISAYCEQIGWTAIMTDQLLKHHIVILSGLIVGVTWAVWHIIPFIQTHNTAPWIFWQCTFTVIYRIMLTKVYTLTNHSVFSTIAMHATYNTAFSLMPYYGSSYDPMYMAIATLCVTIVIFMFTGVFNKNSSEPDETKAPHYPVKRDMAEK
jgi:hypothetical protein